MRTSWLRVQAGVVIALAALAGCGPNTSVDAGGDGGGTDGARDGATDAPRTDGGGDAAMDAHADGGGGDVATDTGPTCTGGQMLCGTTCVNLQNDPANCGACGTACTTGMMCTAGSCQPTCGANETNCKGSCVDLTTDPMHCGACGTACTAGANGTATCAASACGTTCNAGFADCDSMAANGCETDTGTDVMNCGGCGMACTAGANGTASCTAGACGTVCNAGFADCDSMAANGCEANTQTDNANCGGCGMACPSGQLCMAGACTSTCTSTTAGTLTVPGTVSGTLAPGMGSISGGTCQTNAAGTEDIWVLNVPTRSDYVFETGGSFDSVLSIRSNCTMSATEAACDDDSGPGTLSLIRTTLDPGTYYVIVDQYGFSAPTTATPYTLYVSTPNTPAANATCGAATPLTTAGLTGQNTLGGGASSNACLTDDMGGQLFYTVDVPAFQTATITATPTGASTAWKPTIRVLDNCTATSCSASTVASANGSPASVNLVNRATTTRSVVVSVSSDDVSHNGTFDLALAFAPVPSAPNSTCSTATPVMNGTMIMGENIAAGRDVPNAACTSHGSTTSPGATLYYQVTVPANNQLTATVTPSGFNALIQLLPSCGATTCLASADATTSTTGAETINFTNSGTTPATYVIAVANNSGTPSGTFNLSVSLTALVTQTNTTCAMATPVANGTMLTGQNIGAAVDPLNPACASHGSTTTPGTGLYYSVTIPAGYQLSAVATPAGFNAVVQLLPGCGATTCSASVDSTTSTTGAETLTYANRTAAAGSYILFVGNNTGTGSGTFSLAVTLTALPTAPNSVCSMATTVTDGTMLTGENIGAGRDPLNAACGSHGSSTNPGAGLYYNVTVPAGYQLTAVATPSGFNALVQLLPGCGATTCTASVDSTTSTTGAETLRFANTGATAGNYVLVVGNNSGVGVGTFNLAVTFTRLPYLESSIPTMCDDMTGAADLAVTNDDQASAITALPFTIPFFGSTTEGFFSGTSNGFLQLWPTSTGSPSTAYGNAAIPTANPSNFVAPYWDDLAPPSGGGNGIVTNTFGTAPSRHFTVQWTNWAQFSDSTSRLTFQVKLYETTGVIELHYCALTNSTGASATVGLDNAGGTAGVQHSFNTANSVTTTNAIRYTPN